MHDYNDVDKCIYCGSTRQMIEKFNWKCSKEKIPQDRIINERVYNEIAKREAEVKLSKETEPWKRILFKVYHTKEGITSLDQNEFEYYVLNSLTGEVYNGGLEQYFGNSSGDNYTSLMAVLEKYGHLKLKNRIQRIKNHIFGDADVTSRDVRSEILYGESRKTDDPIWDEFVHAEVDVLETEMNRLYRLIAERNGYKCA